MNFQKQANELRQQIVSELNKIKDMPKCFLPHTVYVEVKSDGCPLYKEYLLAKLLANGKCILLNPDTNSHEEKSLNEISLDWLIILWEWYEELSKKTEANGKDEKELFVFLYPLKHFEQHVSDDEILSGWADGYVEKYTPDEFAALINDESFADRKYWVQFIKC